MNNVKIIEKFIHIYINDFIYASNQITRILREEHSDCVSYQRNDPIISAIIIAYSRPFKTADGLYNSYYRLQFPENNFDKIISGIHLGIIELRDKIIAHTDLNSNALKLIPDDRFNFIICRGLKISGYNVFHKKTLGAIKELSDAMGKLLIEKSWQQKKIKNINIIYLK